MMGTVLTLRPDARGGVLRSPTSFEEFFTSEYPILVRIAYGVVRDSHLAEDVAQDVLIAAQRRFPGQYASSHAQAWVKIAAAHAGLNAARSRNRRHEREVRDPRSARSLSPEELAVANEEESQVRAALTRLPRHAAMVLVLRHSGLSYAEIAEAMDVHIGQVGTMLRRAEARFRKEVQS